MTQICAITKILLPLDLSEGSWKGLEYTGNLAAFLGDTLSGITLLHVTSAGFLSRHASNTNDGLRRSAIYQLGELEASDAVIPIMAVLRRCQDEKCRVAAAWALCKIGDARGEYAVKQAVRFDDSRKVQLHAAWYYNLYVSEGTFAFIPSESAPTQIAELR